MNNHAIDRLYHWQGNEIPRCLCLSPGADGDPKSTWSDFVVSVPNLSRWAKRGTCVLECNVWDVVICKEQKHGTTFLACANATLKGPPSHGLVDHHLQSVLTKHKLFSSQAAPKLDQSVLTPTLALCDPFSEGSIAPPLPRTISDRATMSTRGYLTTCASMTMITSRAQNIICLFLPRAIVDVEDDDHHTRRRPATENCLFHHQIPVANPRSW